VVAEMVEMVRTQLEEPVRLLDHVPEVLAEVAATNRLILITKGDLIHQTHKVTTSGLAHHFDHVEIVLEKDAETYAGILSRLGIEPSRFCMVGNSVRSDILPVLALGGSAVHVPYPILWDLEQADEHDEHFAELASLTDLPAWLNSR
jgi:putative hydrolase of the HAD superfamily